MKKRIFLSVAAVAIFSVLLTLLIGLVLVNNLLSETMVSFGRANALLLIGAAAVCAISLIAAFILSGCISKPIDELVDKKDSEIAKQLARVNKEKNRLATIINNMSEGLIILDNDLNIIMLNESAYSCLGTNMERQDCIGKRMSEICSNAQICECIENADSTTVTLDGRRFQLHVNHVLSNSEKVGRIGLLLDVTQRAEIDRIKQEFTANVSHELKTPLTSISGFAELIESGMAKGDDAAVFAGRIHKESQRMLSLISDIIKLSKLDEKANVDKREEVDLLKVAHECREMLEMSAGAQNVTINVSGEKSVVLGTPSELTELIYNLIDNGIRYNRNGGSVNVKITSPAHSPNDPFVILSVADTGIGIAEEHRDRVFERFYRVDKSRSKETGGTGLGLAIVKHVAERHNAKIEIDSRVGEGTVVRVEFYKTNDQSEE